MKIVIYSLCLMLILNISWAKNDFMNSSERLKIIKNIERIKKSYSKEEYEYIFASCMRKNYNSEMWAKRCYDKITGIQKLVDYCNNLFISEEDYKKCLDINK